jgi:hypothetical protein
MQYIQKSSRKHLVKNVFINSKRFSMETKFEILKIETEVLADLIRVDVGKVDIDGKYMYTRW